MQRSLIEIIAEILHVSKEGAKKTRVMYSCNLTHRMAGRFISYLLEVGLLREGDSFHTTEKGLKFLRTYQTLDLLMSTRN